MSSQDKNKVDSFPVIFNGNKIIRIFIIMSSFQFFFFILLV